jgi:DNA repair protein RecN (Recombination protein N)
MLNNLYIKNYALIDKINLSFDSGLTIITGETGAGKSILLGGLELIRGKRSQQGLLKNTTEKSVVEATFNVQKYGLKEFFEQNDLDFEDQSIIRRELLPNGKSRAFVNDTPVKLEQLNTLSEKLLDIHSQHQTLELNRKSFQFELIDAVSGNQNLLKSYQKDFQQYLSVKKQLQDLSVKLMYAEKELEYKKFQLDELNRYQLDEIDFEELEQKVKKFDNLENINQVLSEALQKLDTDDLGILSQIIEVKSGLQSIGKFDEQYLDLAQRMESLQWELQDIIREIEKSVDENDFNPGEQERLQEQYATINKLFLKHQVSGIEALIELRNELASEVTDLSSLEEQMARYQSELNIVTKRLEQQAAALYRNRQEAIPKLTGQIEEILSKLSMKNTRIKIELIQTEDFLSNGKNDIRLLISSDKGKRFGDVKRIASGGELSRIMLAIKTVLSKYKKLPTIIFDEIDSGISGEVAQNMAEVLSRLSKNMQVIVITHLPQIAVKGDRHYKVYKTDLKNISTQVKKLNDEERIYEIAGMLEGNNPSDSALQHARYLLGIT